MLPHTELEEIVNEMNVEPGTEQSFIEGLHYCWDSLYNCSSHCSGVSHRNPPERGASWSPGF